MGGDYLFALLALVVVIIYLFRKVRDNKRYRRK